VLHLRLGDGNNVGCLHGGCLRLYSSTSKCSFMRVVEDGKKRVVIKGCWGKDKYPRLPSGFTIAPFARSRPELWLRS